MSSPAKSMALAIAPKFTAFLSICGSLGIVLKVLFNESRRQNTMHRLVLGMSICDILASIWYFAGTWAIPAGTMSWFGDGEIEQIFWAAGDEDGVSCSFAGFFNQFAVATPLYNSTLAIYYLLIVNYGWSDRRIEKLEWILHLIPVGYALITSIFAVAADLYGHVEWTCWILPGEIFDDSQELSPIQSKFQWIQWIFLFGAVWSCIIVVTTVFVILYRKMKSLESIMTRYSYSTTGGHSGVSSSMTLRNNSTKSAQFRSSSIKGEHSSTGFDVSNKNGADISKDESESRPVSVPENYDIEEAASTDMSHDDQGDGRDDVSKESDSKSKDIDGNDEDDPELKRPQESSTRDQSVRFSCEVQAQPSQEKESTGWFSKLGKKTEQNSKNSRDLSIRSRDSSTGRRAQREVAKSRKIAVQGLLYVGAFYITWMFPTVSRITELVAKKNYFPIQFLDTFLIPLQGFFNFMIYIRPNYLKYRRQGEGFWKSSKTSIFELKID